MHCRALSLFLILAASGKADWKAGIAREKITPPNLMWMSGYGSRTKPAEGTLTDLWAKGLVLEDAKGGRCVLITLDLVGIPRDFSQEVCQDLAKNHSLKRESVCLSCSHTHTGPVVRGNLDTMYGLDSRQAKLVADYRKFLHLRVLAVVETAMKDIAPATLAWGNGEATFAVNRRTNKEADVPALRGAEQLKGPVDHQVPVLRVSDSRGNHRALVFGYACHATVLSFYKWSGDYPGYATQELEKRHPGAVAMFWAGCGGDQNPLPRRKVELAEKYGKELADSVSAVLRGRLNPITGSLETSYAEIKLPLAGLPTREQLVQDSTSKDRFVAARACALLETLKSKGRLRGDYPYPVQAWQIGDGPTLVMLGGEVVVDYALRLKKELAGKPVWVMAYANDVMAYIPSLRVLKEGGYEGGGAMVYYGLPAVWSPKVEELIIVAVKAQAKKVR